jgi:ATP-dependent helicase/nuclease subunit B
LEVLEVVARVSSEQKISISEFINVFSALAKATKVSDIPELADAVLLVSVAEYQPSFVPYVFVTGASDGAFPMAQDDTDIITAQDIANTAVRIEPSASQQYARNRQHAVDIMTSATKKLYISFTGQNPSELVEKMAIMPNDSEVASKSFATHTVLKAIGDGTAFGDTEYYGNVLKSLDLGGMQYINPNQQASALENAQELFFPNGTARVTQIENFRKCPYYHFLENGLRVRVRERNTIAANVMGTVIHKLAEEFTQIIIALGRDGLEKFDAESEMKKVVEKVLYIEEFRFLTAEPKNAPVISNLKKEARLLAREIVRQIRGSKYFPKHAEMPIQGEIEGVVVRGKADRVDVGVNTHAIIIDYKTGAIDKAELATPSIYTVLAKKIYCGWGVLSFFATWEI